MTALHTCICTEERRLKEFGESAARHNKELYEGREGRQPLTVRVTVDVPTHIYERVVNALVVISTSLLISVLIGAGTVIWQTVMKR